MTNSAETIPTSDMRAAMRAFVQRAEVRLSTMHRIAGLFINGAGLLVLFPLLAKDVVQEIILLFVRQSTSLPLATAYMVLALPFFISLLIPLLALYLLLRDLVYFYFTVHSPGFSSRIFNPRFTLTGLGLPIDEVDPSIKSEIFRTQYTKLRNFVLPFNQRAVHFFDDVKESYDDAVIPSTRSLDVLEERGVLAGFTPEEKREVDRFNIALGLAGFLDRTLSEEVARVEISLVRHALALRRLVLRYVEALIVLIWTTLISFIAIALATGLQELALSVEESLNLNLVISSLGFAFSYLIWAIITPIAVGLPMRWLFALNGDAVPISDPAFAKFERTVNLLCLMSGIAVLVAISVILFYWWQH